MKEKQKEIIQWKMDSEIGPLYLVASNLGLKGIYWKKRDDPMVKTLQGEEHSKKIIKKTILEITAYLKGELTEFSIPLDVDGTDFQKRVWDELSKIPYGKTFSYKEIALKLKDPKAARAVGTANGKNPVSLIVPCHRVINTNGKLGGYAGGLSTKKKLLELEKRIMKA